MIQPKTALLLIDVQASFPARDYWVESLAQTWRPKQRAVLNAAQANDIPVVRILHEEPGSQGAFDPDGDLICPLDLGFSVDFISDATLTFPMTRHGIIWSADDIKARTELVLEDRFARIISTQDMINEWQNPRE